MHQVISIFRKLTPRPLVNTYHLLKAVIAIIRYGYPARDLIVIGVTGTDGKTTTSHIIYSILKAAGLPASLISTTGAIVYGKENAPLGLHVTTPNPFEMQRFLQNAWATGAKYIILEATSHGLAQYRVLGCNFQIGVVTNITHEHLDYHGTYERYLLDKARLFKHVKTSILNKDDSSFEPLRKKANGTILTYGVDSDVDFTAVDIEYTAAGTTFTIPAINQRITTNFLGNYNVQNMLAATAVAHSLGISADAIAAGLENATPPTGRLQRISNTRNINLFVDFAHTPNSLENTLKLLHSVADQKLIVVFGCAGDRDQGKRFPMGASAARYCDYTVITAEDPRTESLEKIMDEIAQGCESEGGIKDQTYFRVPDRQEAIGFAIQKLAQPGDIVITAGKAHEQSICFGTVEYPWNEFTAVQNALDGQFTSHLPTASLNPAAGGD